MGLAIVLGVVGLLAVVAGCIYLAGAANSIHFMVGSIHHGHHIYRATGSFVIGIALLVGAWFAARAARSRSA